MTEVTTVSETRETSFALTEALEEFNLQTEEIAKAILAEEYERAQQLLVERGLVVATILKEARIGVRSSRSATPEDDRHEELFADVHRTSEHLASIIREKSAQLADKLVQIHKMKSSQVYTTQGVTHGYR